MAFREMSDDMDIIAKYPDEPYEDDGYTSTAFKAAFDMAGKLCKAAHNALVSALNAATAAGNVGFRRSQSVPANNVQDAIENVQQQVRSAYEESAIPNGSVSENKLSQDLLNKVLYQVGDIFITTRIGNPSELLGYGTWEQIKDTFLIASGDIYGAGETGGEAEHTLTSDEMPNHEHKFYRQNWFAADTIDAGETDTVYSWPDESRQQLTRCVGRDGSYAPVGGGLPHNNMPPYLAVCMWIRIV